MRKIVDEILKVVEERVGSRVDRPIVENSFLFTVASIAGLRRMRYYNKGRENYITFFGTTFAGQGSGKDTSLDVCEEMFGVFDDVPAILKDNYDKMNGPLPTGDEVENINFIVPTTWIVSLRGSIEGMMRTANFYDKLSVGSLNVLSTEFGADFNREVLPLLMKLWQSAKAEGQTNVNEMYPNIEDVPTNILLFGSPKPFKRNEKKHNDLVEIIDSGLGRRTIFVWRDKTAIEDSESVGDILSLKEYGNQLVEYVKGKKSIDFDDEAGERIVSYRKESIAKQNETLSDIDEMRVRSVEKTERLAALIAVADMSSNVSVSHVEAAIAINERSIDALKKIIAPEGLFKQMFEMLSRSETWLGVIDFYNEGIVFRNKQEEKYELERLEHYAKWKGKKLVERGSQYRVEALPATNLQKIKVSINTQGNEARSNVCTPYEVPFFGEAPSIENLVSNPEADWFAFVHFKDDKRSSKNAIPGQNAIAFDIDEGMTVNEAREILTPYTYLLYTTKSHNVEKKGKVSERFRIIFPTKYIFSVDNEAHKKMMENIASVIGLPSYDVSTRNQDRLWYPNPNAQIYTNHGELLDVSCCIPETETEEMVMPAVGSVDATKVSDDKRIQGMIRWTLQNAIVGSRNSALMRLHRFVLDLTGTKQEADTIVYATNQMLTEPLSEIELQRTVCR
ncbi:MAG: hypothetical protein B6D63_07265 [Candidatus Latescibacteria bacterium 4484_7]|nr:MAG: hypothetical protein B6D63_07265 [Candidatus Latescibacteria bacterium 4484_7]